MHFTDYFKPCEFGADGAQLYNGSYYRTKFGTDTLQTMMTDGVFDQGSDDVEDLREVNRLKRDAGELQSELDDAQDEINRLEGEIRELNLRNPKP